MSGTIHFYCSAEESESYPDPHFEILCELLSLIAKTNKVVAEDFDFQARLSKGMELRLMPLGQCRIGTLLAVIKGLENALDPNCYFWGEILSVQKYQGAILYMQKDNDTFEEAKAKLAASSIEVITSFLKSITFLIEETRVNRSHLNPRQQLLTLFRERLSWELRNRAAKENTTIQHIAKKIGL